MRRSTENRENRKKFGAYIVVTFLALLIGLILSTQLRTADVFGQGGLVPIAKLEGYEAELKMIKDERDATVQELVELEERLRTIETEKAQENEIISGLVSDLEKFKMAAGVLDVKGNGIIITIDDPTPADEYQQGFSTITYNFDLLLSLVNRLREAGAEAISINEQRIIASTEISLAGNNININGVATAPPYYIKAIGDASIMTSAITIRGGIIETMKNSFDLNITIEQKEEVIVPRYAGTVNFKYAEPIADV